MGLETAISAGSSLVGAGASLLGGSNASDAAESANRDAQYNASMDRLALMIGFANAYGDFQGNTQNALASLATGYGDVKNYGDYAQNALSGALAAGNGAWNTAYNAGTGYLGNALDEWDSKYAQVRTDNKPYMDLGYQGVAGYSGLLKDPSSIASDPGYQFQLGEGVNALDRSAASRGLLLSGSQQKAIDKYGQDFASTYLDKVLGRYNTAINQGQTAQARVDNASMATAAGKSGVYNALAKLGTTTASGMSNLASTLGQSSANAYINTGNQLNQNTTSQSSDYNTLSNLIQQLWSNTANNLVSVDSGSSQSSASTASAEASSENNAISGLVNSLNGGVKNYLTASGYGTGGSNYDFSYKPNSWSSFGI